MQILTGLAFAVAASANFPALLLSLIWRRLTTTGTVVGIATGLISSIVLIVLSPQVWPGRERGAVPARQPGDRHRPAGFHRLHRGIAALRTRRVAEARFDEVPGPQHDRHHGSGVMPAELSFSRARWQGRLS